MRGRKRTAIVFSIGLLGCDPSPGKAACFGVCGPGTRCEDGQCVVAQPQAESESPEANKRRKQRKSRRRRSARSRADVPDNLPPYDPNRTRVLGEGSERLDDGQIQTGLKREEPAFNACLTAASADRELRGGSITFAFSIAPSGKVTGISATGPEHLRSVLPCLKKVIYDHRFPAWQGPEMDAEYRFVVAF